MMNVKVISLGGSLIAPDGPDTEFIAAFYGVVSRYLDEDPSRKLIFVVGGGAPARRYQQAAKTLCTALGTDLSDSELDQIGIMATRLNAQWVKTIFNRYCKSPVVIDPTADFSFDGQVLPAAGWVPGFSTDNDAVLLARRCSASAVINLSNIAQIYSDDPKTNPNAKPIDHLSWDEYKKMIGSEWVPGRNCPFDPVAAQAASELKLKVITASGKDLVNVDHILHDRPFFGSVIE